MRPPETLETDRLMLRPPTPEDAEWIFEDYAQDPEVTKYLEWRPHESIVMTHEFLRHTLEGWRKGKEFHWVITDKASGDRLGMIAIWLEKPHRAQFGYVLARKHWGNGYATEAARAVVECARRRYSPGTAARDFRRLEPDPESMDYHRGQPRQDLRIPSLHLLRSGAEATAPGGRIRDRQPVRRSRRECIRNRPEASGGRGREERELG